MREKSAGAERSSFQSLVIFENRINGGKWKMSVKIYIDGQEGTTGLKILERFENRNDIEIVKISEELRKDPTERARLINK